MTMHMESHEIAYLVICTLCMPTLYVSTHDIEHEHDNNIHGDSHSSTGSSHRPREPQAHGHTVSHHTQLTLQPRTNLKPITIVTVHPMHTNITTHSHPHRKQTFDTNYSVAAKGEPHLIKLEHHVAGVIAITHDVDFTFTDDAISGSELGPRNTIVVPEPVANKLNAIIASSANNFATYMVKADAVNGPKNVNLEVRIYKAKKGSGAPGVAVKKPWLSICLPKESLPEPNPLRALNSALESLGFVGLKSTQKVTMPLKVRTELVHVEYTSIAKSDGTEINPEEIDWHHELHRNPPRVPRCGRPQS